MASVTMMVRYPIDGAENGCQHAIIPCEGDTGRRRNASEGGENDG
jgi:hypothetical protein